MEISGIDTVHSVKNLNVQENIQPAHIEDTLSISSEAQKRGEWVEMLKQMPDIRETIPHLPPSPSPEILAAVAQKIALQI